ncbi:MAG: hypothetical protein ACOY94_00710 [Bacillota bacterium]
MRRLLLLIPMAALLAGCLGQGPAFPAYRTTAEALGEVLNRQVTIVHEEPFDQKRALVLFFTDRHPGLSPTLLERVGRNNWRMTGAVGLYGPLDRPGSLTYGRGNLGHVEEKRGTVTHVRAETHVIYGEVLDPTITWVELTLHDEGEEPRRAKVQNGIWLVQVPPQKQNTWFDLRAGDEQGVRFAASIGKRASRLMEDPATAPLSLYQDAQLGVKLEHPATFSSPRIDREGRLSFTFSAWTITLERRSQGEAAGPEELLQAALKAATDPKVEVLEHGIRRLGPREAGYLLESRPEDDGKGARYKARYLVPVGPHRYEVTCSTSRVYSSLFWAEHLKPVCDRVLNTIRLGE